MNKKKETQYLKIIKDISEDIGISKDETKSLVDFDLYYKMNTNSIFLG